MLVNILLYNGPKDPTMEAILAILGQGGKVERIDTGVYDCPHFNFSNEVGIHEYDDKYPHLTRITSEEDNAVALANDRPVYESFGCYGVCDNYKQVIEQCKELQPSDPGLYIMSVTRVSRDEQPAEGGWRWHKWGEYIGAQNPQHEYLYDEKDIDEVFCYHVLHVPENMAVELTV